MEGAALRFQETEETDFSPPTDDVETTKGERPAYFHAVGQLNAVRTELLKIQNPELRIQARRMLDRFASQCMPGDTLIVEVRRETERFFEQNMAEVLNTEAPISADKRLEQAFNLNPDRFNILVARAENKGENSQVEMLLRKLAYLQQLVKMELAPGLADVLGKESGRQQMAMKKVTEINRDIQELTKHIKQIKNGNPTETQRQDMAKMLTALEAKVNQLASMPGLKALMSQILQQVKELRQSPLLGLTSQSLASIAPRIGATLNNGKAQGIVIAPRDMRSANTALPRLAANPLDRLALNDLTRSLSAITGQDTAPREGVSNNNSNSTPGLGAAAAIAGAMVLGATTADAPLVTPTALSQQNNNVVHAEPAALDNRTSVVTVSPAEAAKDAAALNTDGTAVNNNATGTTQAPVTVAEALKQEVAQQLEAKAEQTAEVSKQDATEQKQQAIKAEQTAEEEKVALAKAEAAKAAESKPDRPQEALQEVKTADYTAHQSFAAQQHSLFKATTFLGDMSLQLTSVTDEARKNILPQFKKNASTMCENCTNGGNCATCPLTMKKEKALNGMSTLEGNAMLDQRRAMRAAPQNRL
jgi:ferredoxin